MPLIIANTYFNSRDDRERGDLHSQPVIQIKFNAEVFRQTDTATEQSNSLEN